MRASLRLCLLLLCIGYCFGQEYEELDVAVTGCPVGSYGTREGGRSPEKRSCSISSCPQTTGISSCLYGCATHICDWLPQRNGQDISVTSNLQILEVKVKFHIVSKSSTTNSLIPTAGTVASALANLNAGFEGSGITFIQSGSINTVSNYPDSLSNMASSVSGNLDFIQKTLDNIRTGGSACGTSFTNTIGHSVTPASQVNVFFVCFEGYNSNDVIYGLAQFPWDTDSVSATGGIFVSCESTNSNVLVHEMGHALGLWHIYQGSIQNNCGQSCTNSGMSVHNCGEMPFVASNAFPWGYTPAADRDYLGDFCKDTPTTPNIDATSSCVAPGLGMGMGAFCSLPSNVWSSYYANFASDESFENFMAVGTGSSISGSLPVAGYDSCWTRFTDDQVARMRCFLCNSDISGWLTDYTCQCQ